MIEYYIDGSTKDNTIGAGIVKVNEFGFVEKYHFNIEHINPSSLLAEGYAFEKTLEMVKENDLNKKEKIDIYTDNQKLYSSFLYQENIDFNSSDYFTKQESNNYYQHLRKLYLELNASFSNAPIYYCDKTQKPRPLIKVYFKDEVEDKKFFQDAHLLSREYIKEKTDSPDIELKAIRKNNKWYIVKNDKDIVAENKRPVIALSYALKLVDNQNSHIKLCDKLVTILKSTNKNKLSNDAMKTAVKVIESHKNIINF